MKTYKMVEFNAEEIFEDESIDWKYCRDNATYVHSDPGACEFIFYLSKDNFEPFRFLLKKMKDHDCSQELMKVFKEARNKEQADYLLLYI